MQKTTFCIGDLFSHIDENQGHIQHLLNANAIVFCTKFRFSIHILPPEVERSQYIGMRKYDLIIVGAGLYGAVFARKALDDGLSVLVIEKRNHIAGNLYTEEEEGIHVHKYGAHIFHTNNQEVWEFITRFANFNRYTNAPIANYKGELYSLPFNMYTFNKLWGCVHPQEARAIIEQQRKQAGISTPRNLEEQAISLVGTEIFEKLIKGYTEKQWGRPCSTLPAFIIKRLPVRYTFDNNYFDAEYQGIPRGGYTNMISRMLEGVDIITGTDYLQNRDYWNSHGQFIVYTGPIDAYYNYQYGPLEYRSVRFVQETLNLENFQGNAVINYTDKETPFTRIIEHKWFDYNNQGKTIISKEYSHEWAIGTEPYYPINNEQNNYRYQQYRLLADREKNIIIGGRLGEFKYYDMDVTVASALQQFNNFSKSGLNA